MEEQMQTDHKLIDAFLGNNDESAFAELVRRHAGMVYGVCNRILADHHDAEDATQATFVILAQKAETIRKRSSLSSWLHTVARTSSKYVIRANANRRKREEFSMENVDPVSSPETDVPEELLTLLDDAIAGLSDHQREAVLLRHIQSHSVADAARLAGCSEEAMKSRTKGGVRKLRRIFSRRGITVGVTLLLASMEAQAQIAVPQSLLHLSMAASKLVAASAATDAAGSSVMSLAEGVIKMMIFEKVKSTSVIAVATLAVILVGVGVLQGVAGERPDGGRSDAKPRIAKAKSLKPEAVASKWTKAIFLGDVPKLEGLSGSSFYDSRNGKWVKGKNSLKKLFEGYVYDRYGKPENARWLKDGLIKASRADSNPPSALKGSSAIWVTAGDMGGFSVYVKKGKVVGVAGIERRAQAQKRRKVEFLNGSRVHTSNRE